MRTIFVILASLFASLVYGQVGGNDKDVQFNASGAFGGDDNFQWDKTHGNGGSLFLNQNVQLYGTDEESLYHFLNLAPANATLGDSKGIGMFMFPINNNLQSPYKLEFVTDLGDAGIRSELVIGAKNGVHYISVNDSGTTEHWPLVIGVARPGGGWYDAGNIWINPGATAYLEFAVDGSLVMYESAEPTSTYGGGYGNLYIDSTSHNFAFKNGSGVINHGIQTKAAVTGECLTGVDDDGTVHSAAASLVSGSVLEVLEGTPAPSGFTKIGTSKITYKDLTGHNKNLNVDVYRKD